MATFKGTGSSLKQILIYLLRQRAGEIIFSYLLFLILCSAPIYIYRWIVTVIAKWFRRDFNGILSSMSSYHSADLLYNESPRYTIVVSATLQGAFPKEEMKGTVLKNWITAKVKETGELIYKKLQQYPHPWMGFFFWRGAGHTFNLDNHLKFHGGEEDVEVLVEKLLNEGYTPEQSPWELHVINTKVSSEAPVTVIILKIHHCLGDGYSLVAALVEGFCEVPMTASEIPRAEPAPRTFLGGMVHYVTLPFRIYYEASYACSKVFNSSQWKITPYKKKSWRQVVAKSKELISVEKIKDIKNQFGVSFSSVLMSAIGAALSRLRKVPGKEGDYDGDYTYAFCPLPLPGHKLRLTNHYTAALLDIPTACNVEPVKRLRKCHSTWESVKHSALPIHIRYIFFRCLGANLSIFIRLFHYYNSMTAVVLSILPSVPNPIEKDGRKCLGADFVAGLLSGNAGVGISVLSYNQNVRICVSADEAVMSRADAIKLTQFVTDEINMLHGVAENMSFTTV